MYPFFFREIRYATEHVSVRDSDLYRQGICIYTELLILMIC
jgi:hypothetical protein